jgi:hypothetical protein
MFTRSTSMVAALLIVCLNTVLAQSPPPVSFLPAVNYGAGSGPISMAIGDFNGDGKPDLAVANRDSNDVSVLLGNGDGTFQAAVNYGAGSGPISMAMGDFNGDGKPDLAVANDGVGSGYCNTQTSTSCLRNVPGFTSAIDGTIKSFTRAHVTADAQYRPLATANALLTEGTYIYSVGLATNVDKAFLQQIANDPSSSTYNPNLPAGMAMFAPNCPSSTCTADMQQIFQTIAAQILLPLTL